MTEQTNKEKIDENEVELDEDGEFSWSNTQKEIKAENIIYSKEIAIALNWEIREIGIILTHGDKNIVFAFSPEVFTNFIDECIRKLTEIRGNEKT